MGLTREQIREVIQSLQLYGEIPMKFAYIGEGAEAWSKISRERMADPFFTGYEITGVKHVILSKYFLDRPPKRVNIVDLGCGTGEPAMKLTIFLESRGVEVEYIPVDLSKELLNKATKLFKRRGINTTPIYLDFDANSLKPAISEVLDDDPTIFLFLGNTLGNHSNELHILTNIRQVMRKNDILVVGLYLYNPFFMTKELRHYQQDQYSKELLYTVPRTLFGITEANSVYNVEYIPDERIILASITVMEDIEVTVDGERLEIPAGSKIIVGRSKRYLEEEIAENAREAGFYIEHMTTDRRGTVAVVGYAPRLYV